MAKNLFQPEQSLTYSDIGLRPTQCSTVESRTLVDTKCKFGKWELDLPVVAAPMAKVVGDRMVAALGNLGGLAFLPRTEDGGADINMYETWRGMCIPSVPATNGYMDRLEVLTFRGCKHVCIDVANGFHSLVERAVKTIKDKYPDLFIITGNVASVEGYIWLSELGVDAVRVGIGGGSVCTTSIATGVGVGQASVVRECAQYRQKYLGTEQGALIIADGGIKIPADVCKAIALGADVVMAGGLFAGTEESPGEVVIHNDKKYKHMAGQASMHIKGQRSFVEGADVLVPYKGKLEKVWNGLDQGLRSSMAYMNCHTLEDLRYLPDHNFTMLSDSAKYERGVHAKP